MKIETRFIMRGEMFLSRRHELKCKHESDTVGTNRPQNLKKASMGANPVGIRTPYFFIR